MDKPLRDLLEMIHFTEKVATKIHGVMDEKEIYRVVVDEFAKSKRYNASIFLLTDDGSKLRIAETSLVSKRMKAGLKVIGLRSYESFRVNLDKSSFFSQVVRQGETVKTEFIKGVNELFPRPLATLITKTIGYEERSGILTPLKQHGKIIGALVVDFPELGEYLIPSVKNLASHISTALRLAKEHAEHVKMDERVRESEAKYRNLFENARDVIVTFDLKGIVTSVNEAATEYGFKKDEVIGKKMLKFCSKKYWPILLKDLANIIRGKPVEGEIEIITPKGKRIAEYRSNPIRRGKKVVAFQSILRDITERKRVEEELIRLSNAVKMSTDSIVVSDMDGKIIDVNEATLKMYDSDDREDLIGKSSFELIAPEDRERALAGMKEVLEKGCVKGLEYNVITKDGGRISVEMSVAIMKDADDKPIGFVGVSRDITERKRLEEVLIYERDLLHSLMDNIPDSIYFKDVESRFMRVNEAKSQKMGLKNPNKAVGKTDFDFYTEKFAQETLADEQRIMKTGSSLIGKVEKVMEKDGTTRWVSATKVPIKDSEGRVKGLIGISRNITEMKNMEEKLRKNAEHLEELVEEKTIGLQKSEENYRNLVDLAPDGIVTLNMKGVITSCNKTVLDSTGCSEDEIIGKDFTKLGFLRVRNVPKYLKLFYSILRGKQPKAFEVDWYHKDGTPYSSEVRFRLIKEDDKTIGIQTIARDITERKRMEERLRDAERLAAIGETAAMVGHDLRNPLQAIVTVLSLSKDKIESLPYLAAEKKKAMLEKYETILRQVWYMDKIVSDLQDYSRPIKPNFALTSLRRLIEDTLSTIKVPENIKVSVKIKEGLKAMIDPHLMKRCFTNLVMNAVQAMPDGGRLTIRARETGEATVISVQDTGVGIGKKNLPHLFHPLFTTKSKGVGFGLAVCKRMVEAHGGTITVKSKVGEGSTFTVNLPLGKEGE